MLGVLIFGLEESHMKSNSLLMKSTHSGIFRPLLVTVKRRDKDITVTQMSHKPNQKNLGECWNIQMLMSLVYIHTIYCKILQ